VYYKIEDPDFVELVRTSKHLLELNEGKVVTVYSARGIHSGVTATTESEAESIALLGKYLRSEAVRLDQRILPGTDRRKQVKFL